MPISVYVLKGLENGKHYVGITNNLARRLREHTAGSTKAGQLLGDFRLLHYEDFEGYSTARKRERFLKSGQGRKWLDEFEAGSGPARGG